MIVPLMLSAATFLSDKGLSQVMKDISQNLGMGGLLSVDRDPTIFLKDPVSALVNNTCLSWMIRKEMKN